MDSMITDESTFLGPWGINLAGRAVLGLSEFVFFGSFATVPNFFQASMPGWKGDKALFFLSQEASNGYDEDTFLNKVM